MRRFLVVVNLFFFAVIHAHISNDTILEVEKEGMLITVVDFREGDKIKLFEVETGDHILTKSTGQVDLSMLPSGKYLLEDNNGRSVIIERTEEDVVIEEELTADYLVEADSEFADIDEMEFEEELEMYYKQNDAGLLHIEREGEIITVLDFRDGDEIKLFEVKNTVHVLSKTQGFIDLSQLPVGVYFIQNNRGQSVVVEKLVEKKELMAADM